jgi:L-asparaginase
MRSRSIAVQSEKVAPDTEFDARHLDALPRVDIAYSYAGSDGTAVRAFVAAGATGRVVAGFAPGMANRRSWRR